MPILSMELCCPSSKWQSAARAKLSVVESFEPVERVFLESSWRTCLNVIQRRRLAEALHIDRSFGSLALVL